MEHKYSGFSHVSKNQEISQDYSPLLITNISNITPYFCLIPGGASPCVPDSLPTPSHMVRDAMATLVVNGPCALTWAWKNVLKRVPDNLTTLNHGVGHDVRFYH